MQYTEIPEFLTSKEVAAILRVSPYALTMQRYRKSGPPFVRPSEKRNSRVLYPKQEFLQWLSERHSIAGTAEQS